MPGVNLQRGVHSWRFPRKAKTCSLFIDFKQERSVTWFSQLVLEIKHPLQPLCFFCCFFFNSSDFSWQMDAVVAAHSGQMWEQTTNVLLTNQECTVFRHMRTYSHYFFWRGRGYLHNAHTASNLWNKQESTGWACAVFDQLNSPRLNSGGRDWIPSWFNSTPSERNSTQLNSDELPTFPLATPHPSSTQYPIFSPTSILILFLNQINRLHIIINLV